MTGQAISADAGNRAPAQYCVDTQGVRPVQQQRLTEPQHLRPRLAWPGAPAVFG